MAEPLFYSLIRIFSKLGDKEHMLDNDNNDNNELPDLREASYEQLIVIVSIVESESQIIFLNQVVKQTRKISRYKGKIFFLFFKLNM